MQEDTMSQQVSCVTPYSLPPTSESDGYATAGIARMKTFLMESAPFFFTSGINT
jgi:hypothetical protein